MFKKRGVSIKAKEVGGFLDRTVFGEYLVRNGMNACTVYKIEQLVRFPEERGIIGDIFDIEKRIFQAWYKNPVNLNRLDKSEREELQKYVIEKEQ